MSTTTTCQMIVWRKRSRGILGRGTESFVQVADICGGQLHEGHELCARHETAARKMDAKLSAKRAAQ